MKKVKKSHCIKLFMIVFVALTFTLPIYPAQAAKTGVRFGDMGWDSAQVHNRIVGFILENGYGYDVEYIPGETIMLLSGLAEQDIDIITEMWVENNQKAYDKHIKNGKIVDLGSNFSDSWQGWLVPTYMIRGDAKRGIKPITPDLKSVSDLPKYWKVFKDPEDPSKGRFYNSVPGWGCTEVNSRKLKVYGLDKYYNDFITGSDAALNGSMASAYKRGKPWVGYYWAPTWVLGKLDMTPLEEPPYDKKVWDETRGCAYLPVSVNILTNPAFAKRAPEVVELLRKYETTSAMTNKILAYMRSTKCDTESAARWFLLNNKDVWANWIPENITVKVKASLK